MPPRRRVWPVDPSTRPTYNILFLWTGLVILGILFSDFSWAAQRLHGSFVAIFVLIGSAMLLRSYGHPHVGGPIEAFALLSLSSLLAMASTALLSATDLPLMDGELAMADRALGFDWLTLWHLLNRSPFLIEALTAIYHTIFWQPILLFPLLFAKGRGERCWTMLHAWMLGLVISVALFPIFPAKAAFNYYNVSQPPGSSAANFWPIMEAIRENGFRILDHRSVRGMITFPSFHAASGIFFIWGTLTLRWVKWPVVALNVAMILTAIPIGGHYAVDVIGGIVIAMLAIAVATRSKRATASD